jgi:Ca2+-binding RTX toxin-like protein
MNYLFQGPTVQLALETTQELLKELAGTANFADIMQQSFGSNGAIYQQAWVKGDFTQLPAIEIVESHQINGAKAAYAGFTHTIYLSREFLTQNHQNLTAIIDILAEEIGHAIDHQLNLQDTPGDEGALFAALVQGKTLTNTQLQALKTENDWATISLNNLSVQIEQAEGDPLIRKNAKTLTPEEKQRFVNAVKALKVTPSEYGIDSNNDGILEQLSVYDYYVKLHQLAFGESSFGVQNRNHTHYGHSTPGFLPWHRQYLHAFEKDLQAIDPTVTIPYWDWTDEESNNAVFSDDLMGGNGDPFDNNYVTTGPFAAPSLESRSLPNETLNQQGVWTLTFNSVTPLNDWNPNEKFLQRQFGQILPTQADVANALSISVYDQAPYYGMNNAAMSFRKTLEGWTHGAPHNWVNGPMSSATSPNDPVFFLHHANVDRLWSQWMSLYQDQPGFHPYLPLDGDQAGAGFDINDPLYFFPDVTPEMLLDTTTLGYIYDDFAVVEPIDPGVSILPQVYIQDLSVIEGNFGSTFYDLKVSLSAPSVDLVSVDVAILGDDAGGSVAFESTLTSDQVITESNSMATGLQFMKLNGAGTEMFYRLFIQGLDFGPLFGQPAQTPDLADDVTSVQLMNGSADEEGLLVFDVSSNTQDPNNWSGLIDPVTGYTDITGIWDTSDLSTQPLSNFIAELQSSESGFVGEAVDLYWQVNTKGSPNGDIRGQLLSETFSISSPEGRLVFNPGETEQRVEIEVFGDSEIEFDDIFFVELSNPEGAQLADELGKITVRNDDFFETDISTPTLPQILVDDVSVLEGNSGSTFSEMTIRLSEPSDEMVMVDYEIFAHNTQGQISFNNILSDDQVVESTNSEALGTYLMQLNEAGDALSYKIKVLGLDFGSILGTDPQTSDTADDVTSLHLYSGARGENGSLVLDLSNNTQDADWSIVQNTDGSTEISGIWDTTDASTQSLSNFAEELLAAQIEEDTNLYLSIQTTGSPQGEIRGQIVGEAYDSYLEAFQGQLMFNAGEIEKTIPIEIIGDTLFEFDESGFIQLSNPMGAEIADDLGVLTILDDDAPSFNPPAPTPTPVPPLTPSSPTPTPTPIKYAIFETIVEIKDLPASLYTPPVPAAPPAPPTPTRTGSRNSEQLYGNGQADVIDSDQGEDQVYGWQGNDSLSGGAGGDTLYGNQGNDNLYGGDDADELYGGQGGDNLYGETGDDRLYGELGDDNLYATEGSNLMYGNQGNDNLYGGTGSDTMYGGQNNDSLYGYGGDDVVIGNLGNDRLCGVAGNNVVYGNQGNDTLTCGPGNNTLYGGQDNDLIYGNRGQNALIGNLGNDSVMGGAGTETLYGNQGVDVLYGDAGVDSIYGGKENDVVVGGADNDYVTGDLGDDVITGTELDTTNPGMGEIDTLQGGAGADTFVLASNTTVYYNDGNAQTAGVTDYALILDFQAGEDNIVLGGGATDYTLAATSGSLPVGTGIYLQTAGQNELIAIVQNSSNLNLNSSQFSYL